MSAAKSERFEMRLEPEFLHRIDDWRLMHGSGLSRAEAMRRLANIGLGTQTTRQSFVGMKFQILVAALTDGPGSRISDAYVFAWDTEVYPVFHDMTPWHTPFEHDFSVSKEMMDELMTYLDQKWLEDAATPTFYELEETFGPRYRASDWDRMALINACRYAFLDDRFDTDFWKRLLSRAQYPTEAREIKKPFDRSESASLT